MISVSRGSVGSFCVVPSASSRSAWYELFTLMQWIQGATPAVGLVRTTVCGPFQCGAKELCFQSLSTPDPLAHIHESVSQGEWHPFLYKLSYLIYYLTQLFHLLWNLISPYLRQICWHLFCYGRGPPIHNSVQRTDVGLWGHPESEQSHQKQAHPGAVSL